MALSLFPARVRVADENGFMTPEFYRALTSAQTSIRGLEGSSSVFAPFFGDITKDVLALETVVQPLPAEYIAESITQPPYSDAWPIGSIFVSVVATNPATLIGYGTWAQIAAGRVLVGLDAADVDFDTLRETGGAKTKAISAHSGTAVTDHADHTHGFTQSSNAASPDLVAADTTAAGVAASGTTGGASAILNHSVTQPSDHTALNVVQPYYVVALWERTA